MSYLFFDTETTGLPQKHLPINHANQPRICQIGAIETDEEGGIKAELNFIVRPDGWEIPEQASKLHGIYQADAIRYGMSMKVLLPIMQGLMSRATKIVAHNIEFDIWMVGREQAVYLDSRSEHTRKHYCTMKESIDIVKCPPTERMLAAGMTGFKAPTLTEAYRYFFGKTFDNAHDAMADVRACKEIFFKLQELNNQKVAA